MGQMGDAGDAATAALNFAPDEAKYLMAAELVVDAGGTAKFAQALYQMKGRRR
jgi:hypothetical protein